ncbi:hypothetical protein BXZ70DRAFT_957086 [Cristinia sonorae]|uniref:Uncharacterized protein n=1 Tax=Cristinia sonorae TaxID=1940300 RepID=A0A8K0UG90_9AGAR|nr:hypothetical protein BXZ70DRAFT_957086 [Cristinia sonorae]
MGQRARNVISEVRDYHFSKLKLTSGDLQRPKWNAPPSPSPSPPSERFSSDTNLHYSDKGVVGVRMQSSAVQEVGYMLMQHMTFDMFFMAAYPRPDQIFSRYRKILFLCTDRLAKNSPSPEPFFEIATRADRDTRYCRGLISMGQTRLRNHRSDLKATCAGYIEDEYKVTSKTRDRILAWTNDGAYLLGGDVDVRSGLLLETCTY